MKVQQTCTGKLKGLLCLASYLRHHLGVELLVPGAQQGVGNVQTLAIKTAAPPAAAAAAAAANITYMLQ
jgi:hypothetical protein